MIFNVYIDRDSYQLDVPREILDEGGEFFSRMDRDMGRGWQMGREYVENPDIRQRCQIAADKILTALHAGNRKVTLLMAGYILARTPGAVGVRIDISGEMANTELIMAPVSRQRAAK